MSKDTDAQICTIQIFDSDGVMSIEISHTVTEYFFVSRYGKHVMDLSYDEARAMAKALKCLSTEAQTLD